MRARRRVGRCAKGFSLVEAMVGLMVLFLAVLVLVPAFVFAESVSHRSRHMEQATQAANEQLESWRRASYTSLPAIASGQSSVSQTFSAPASLPTATGTITFTRVDATLAPTTSSTSERTQVTAVISWTGRGADKGTVTVGTLIAKED